MMFMLLTFSQSRVLWGTVARSPRIPTADQVSCVARGLDTDNLFRPFGRSSATLAALSSSRTRRRRGTKARAQSQDSPADGYTLYASTIHPSTYYTAPTSTVGFEPICLSRRLPLGAHREPQDA